MDKKLEKFILELKRISGTDREEETEK